MSLREVSKYIRLRNIENEVMIGMKYCNGKED